MMRIFFLEPFLIKTESHFIEVAIAISTYFQKANNVSFYLIGNKHLTPQIKNLFPNVLAGITHTCFQNMDDHGTTFYQDLCELDTQFNFQKSDLIVIPTAYENQILGVSTFEKEKSDCPMIALQFHQLFPPSKESDDIAKPHFRRLWINRLKKAFATIKSPQISYWTTESLRLNKDFNKISPKSIGMLPVPITDDWQMSHKYHYGKSQKRIRVGYLGDGRQEKGLLLWLKVIKNLKNSEEYHFVIQLNNPRGFSSNQQHQFKSLLTYISKLDNIEILEGSLQPEFFYQIFRSLDVVMLPYNPNNYCRRVSGLAMQAAIYKKPIITSSGTWSANALKQGHLAGISFKYEKNNEEQTISNIISSLEKFIKIKEQLDISAINTSNYFSVRNSPSAYIKQILDFYELPD